MDELLTQKAISEILQGMQTENNKHLEERKVNPLGKPNKNFLDRTIHSVINHNKREMQRTQINCQQKLKELNEFCDNRDRYHNREINAKRIQRRKKEKIRTSEKSKRSSYKHRKRRKSRSRIKESGSRSDHERCYDSSDKPNGEKLGSSPDECDAEVSYNMQSFHNYQMIRFANYQMLQYLPNGQLANQLPETDIDIDAQIMRDLQSSPSNASSKGSFSDGNYETIQIPSSSSSSCSSRSSSPTSSASSTSSRNSCSRHTKKNILICLSSDEDETDNENSNDISNIESHNDKIQTETNGRNELIIEIIDTSDENSSSESGNISDIVNPKVPADKINNFIDLTND